jgi:putative ABC transport system permease protein
MKDGRIIGVIKDFNYKSLYDKMEVAVMLIYPPAYWKVAVKIKSSDLQSSINQVKKYGLNFLLNTPSISGSWMKILIRCISRK